jgi:dTMP kinase
MDSTAAYQGYGRKLDLDLIHTLNNAVTEGHRPDITVLLDVDPDLGLTRGANDTAGDAIEGHWQAGLSLVDAPAETSDARAPSSGRRVGGRDMVFHRRVRNGFRSLAKAEPGRWLVLDATRPRDELAAAIWARIEPLLDADEESR